MAENNKVIQNFLPAVRQSCREQILALFKNLNSLIGYKFKV